jgi:hypothetical protein
MQQKLHTIRKHVLDDVWELIKAKSLVDPLISSPSLRWLRSDAEQAALFIRMQLSRQVILILTRLNATPGSGRTGDVASIMALLQEASDLNIISRSEQSTYLDTLSQMKKDIQSQGTSFADLVTFRNSELAHSLHSLKIGIGGLSYFVISQFSDATLQLITDIEKTLTDRGCKHIADIEGFALVWSKNGSDFWSFLTK